MVDTEITDEDIKKISKNTIGLSFDILKKLNLDVEQNILPIIIPTTLSNGYKVSSTIDDYGHTKIRHLSISSSDGDTDPAVADKIALKILGKGYVLIGEIHVRGVYHYMKPL